MSRGGVIWDMRYQKPCSELKIPRWSFLPNLPPILGGCHDYQRSTWSVVLLTVLAVTKLTNPRHTFQNGKSWTRKNLVGPCSGHDRHCHPLWKGNRWTYVQPMWGKTTDEPMFNRCWLYDKLFLGSPTCEPLLTYDVYTCMFPLNVSWSCVSNLLVYHLSSDPVRSKITVSKSPRLKWSHHHVTEFS